MSLIEWRLKETPGGNIFTSDMVDGYIIHQYSGKFFIHRNDRDCDDIGPLEDFRTAEDVILKIAIALTEFEDKLWCASAAMAMPDILVDGTANQLPDGPEVEDGHDCEGFPGGCERHGCPGGKECVVSMAGG